MAHILVVDDHKDFRDAVRIFLEGKGHEVVDAEDGTEALRLCRGSRPDLVILDIFMPGKDGIETLWQIREERVANKVIVISAGKHTRGSAAVDAPTVLEVARAFG